MNVHVNNPCLPCRKECWNKEDEYKKNLSHNDIFLIAFNFLKIVFENSF